MHEKSQPEWRINCILVVLAPWQSATNNWLDSSTWKLVYSYLQFCTSPMDLIFEKERMWKHVECRLILDWDFAWNVSARIFYDQFQFDCFKRWVYNIIILPLFLISFVFLALTIFNIQSLPVSDTINMNYLIKTCALWTKLSPLFTTCITHTNLHNEKYYYVALHTTHLYMHYKTYALRTYPSKIV